MKITLEPLPPDGQEEIVIRTDCLDDGIMRLIYAIKTNRSQLVGYNGDEMVPLRADEVFYFETVDNRVYACCEKSVYEIKQKLYELQELFESTDMLRISKAMIVNLSKITKIVPMLNGRLGAVLENGEKVVISRQYVPELKKKLGV